MWLVICTTVIKTNLLPQPTYIPPLSRALSLPPRILSTHSGISFSDELDDLSNCDRLALVTLQWSQQSTHINIEHLGWVYLPG